VSDVPETFARAVDTLRGVRLRPEIDLQEAPAPQRLAPYAVALTADVVAGDAELGTGRFVVLHDPAGHETWQGTFRVVTFVRGTVEPDLAADPLATSVAWSWLVEALDNHQVVHSADSGTVTRVVSEPFGTMADRQASAELEVRASWTAPDSRLGPHLEAWGDLLGTVCGLPPLVTGVVASLPQRGNARRSR
jgi:Protein of unknown function (DUF3000)